MKRLPAGLLGLGALVSATIFAAVFQPAQLLVDINQAPLPVNSNPVTLCETGSARFIFGTDTEEQDGLWRTDGTTAGTYRVANFGHTAGYPTIECLHGSSTLALFQYTDENGVSALWRSDGTEAGTFRLLRQPGANDGPIYFMGAASLLAFMANDGVHGNEIMATDGTIAGTHIVADLTPGPDGSWTSTGSQIVANGLLYFANHGNLWASDLTENGTRQVSNFIVDPNDEGSLDNFQAFRSGVVFRHSTPDGASSIYYHDGANTTALRTLQPASPPDLLIGGITVNDTHALFTVWHYQTGETELWTSDGTVADTHRIAGPDGDLDPGFTFSPAGSRLIFWGWTAATGRELWTTDGTDAGTLLLRDFSAGPDSSSIQVNYASNTLSAIRVFPSDGTRPIWVTDGTIGGTRPVSDLDASLAADTLSLIEAGFIGTDYYFWRIGSPFSLQTETYQLWRYSTTAHTVENRGSITARSLSPMASVGNRALLFSTDDPATGIEPWITNGTIAGTKLLANLAPENMNGGSEPGPFMVYDSIALFGATGSDGRTGLWRSDGTAGGTQRLGDGAPVGDVAPYLKRQVRLGARLLYGGLLESDHWELFSTDGTAAGTNMVIDLSSTSLPFTPLWTSNPAWCGAGFVTLNGKAYYGASPGRVGTLYRTDGTTAGTESLGAFPTSARLFNPSSVVCVHAAYKDRVYFSAEDPDPGSEAVYLWRNDGTPNGNTRFKNSAGRDLTISDPVLEIDGLLYFTGTDGVSSGLWRSDGNSANTTLLLPASAFPDQQVDTIFNVGSTIYFKHCAGSSTVCRLYRTDGTAAGTIELAITDNFQRPELPGNPVTASGKLLFTGKDAAGGEEPWITDGTVAGTRQLKDVVPGTEGSSPSSAFMFNGLTYFYVTRNDGNFYVKDLWRTDGTPQNTERANLMPAGSRVVWENAQAVGQKLLLAGYNDTVGNELWVVENEAPVATPDNATTTAPTAVDVTVAANDSDPDGLLDSASVRVAQAPGHGTAVVNAGVIRYTPNAGFTGTDSFTYAISDRQQRESAPATVTITVNAPPPSGNGGGSSGGGKKGGGGLDPWLLVMIGLMVSARYWRSRA